MKNNDYNLNDEPDFPLDDKGKNTFGLPPDYFSLFEDKLKKRLEAENELKDLPLLSSIKKNNSFTIPANYFNERENSLEYKVELAAYSKLQSINKPVFSDLEEDYKLKLQSSVNYKIELTDELKPHVTLYALDKISPFSVPEIYFESITEQVKERIYFTKEVKVSVFNTVLDFIFGKKMAFTLGLVIVIGLISYFNQSHETIDQTGDCKTLACLERQEILNNKTMSNFDEDQLIDLVDINSLNKQLNLKEQKRDSLSFKNNVLETTDAEELLDGL